MFLFLQQAGRFLACILLFSSGAILLSLMGLTVIEVVGRYGLNTPIQGKQDIAKFMLAASLFLVLPVMTLRREHIDVDLLDGLFIAPLDFVRDRFIDLFVGASLLVMSWWIWDRAEKFLKRGSATDTLSIPIYPITYFIAVMVAISGALLVFWAIVRCFYFFAPHQKS